MYLAIETSSLVSSVALGTSERLYGELTVQAALTHSEQLIPHIDALLKMTGCDKKQLQGIITSLGPGSFTGLRIGLGTAKALAYGLSVPLCGVMTMDALAYNVPYSTGLLAVLIDAQKQNVYEAVYRWREGKLETVQAPIVLSMDDALADLANRREPVLFLGDGASMDVSYIEDYNPLFKVARPDLVIPKASSLLTAGIARFVAGEEDDPMTLVPYYLRRSEAEVLWEKRHGTGGDQ